MNSGLLEALSAHAAENRLGLHTPGHQQGKGLLPAFSRLLADYGAALDLTELPGLDCLAAPAGCLAKSQEDFAALTGSSEAFYLVNGATGGLQAAMLAMSGPGVPTFFPAFAHASIYQGLVLSGGWPMVLPCSVDRRWGLPLGIDKEAAGAVLAGKEAGQGEALWVSVNPTYHGVMADLAWEKETLAAHPQWAWLEDEAHGAHLPYVRAETGCFTDGASAKSRTGLSSADAKDAADRRRGSAIAFGAQAVVQSLHKMAAGFTQTAVLHCCHVPLAAKLRETVNILQSSSPSYLLLASIDAWKTFLANGGREDLRRTDRLAEEVACQIRAMGAYRLWQDELPDG